MISWTRLRSPISHAPLQPDTAHSLAAVGERWPVIEGIPYLRADRLDLASASLAALDDGREDDALVLLLADQDNWARTAPPTEQDRRRLVRDADGISFRSAMDMLAFGPVGTYFAHRWSDPTFLSGLALAEAHWHDGSLFELACGAGHFLRAFARRGDPVAGGDIVFAKLWLARRYLAPEAPLVCFDAAASWPFEDGAFGTAFCHDAFYFLPNKPHVAAEMQRLAGRALVGHAHNSLVDNLSSGSPLAPGGYAGLFEDAVLFDDQELTAALIEVRAPRAASADALADAPAISIASRAGAARPVLGAFALPEPGTPLRRNPLYHGQQIRWPSERYETEYGPLATYPLQATGPETAIAGADAVIDGLVRRRVLLDLPQSW